MNTSRAKRLWTKFWVRRAGLHGWRRLAAHLATVFTRGFYGQVALSRLTQSGFISAKAEVIHPAFFVGNHCYLDDRVLVFQDRDGGSVSLGDRVHLHRDTTIQTGRGGAVTFGDDCHIQPRCQFSAYVGSITIGCRAEIAPGCAFYPYDHGTSPGVPIHDQPLTSRGGISIGDDAWLGYGVVVLDGVHIGNGAVIGAGSVVNRDIPSGTIAVGSPARVIRQR